MAATAELPISLDRGAEMPLPAQLTVALRELIDGGTLRPGERLPATRTLAEVLGVARGVVVVGYEQLIGEGYLVAGHGRGTIVNPELVSLRVPGRLAEREDPGVPLEGPRAKDRALSTASAPPVTSAEEPLPVATPQGVLAPGVPITDAVDRPAWRAAWRTAAGRALVDAPDLGDPAFRTEIAEHLRLMRGTTRPASDIIITAGAREGLSLLLTALGSVRGRRLVVGVEDPGYPSLRQVAGRHDAQIVALPVDGDGLQTSELPRGLLDAVIVTPSHQYPLGGSLPLTRRRELLGWARDTGVVIIEDDYDSELRHTGNPLPTLAALDDPERGVVVLLGTFSKTLTQAISAGFLLAPKSLRTLIEPVRHDIGGPVSAVVQSALAEYLASGELRRHTARMRKRYALRRERVVERLYGLPSCRVRAMSGGLHAVIEFGETSEARSTEKRVLSDRENTPEQPSVAALGAVALSGYWQSHAGEGERYGLVIGMGGSDEKEFEDALSRLRERLGALLQ